MPIKFPFGFDLEIYVILTLEEKAEFDKINKTDVFILDIELKIIFFSNYKF